jgi:MFS family permease
MTERTRTRPDARLGASYWKLFSASVISNTGDGMGLIAYPWLASAVTRNPLLIGLVSVANRLPWLVFSLPAGVITDRVDRRVTMVICDVLRAGLTLLVAFVVLAARGSLPGVDDLDSVTTTRPGLYLVLLIATLLLGMAEVLRDNCGQTLMPSLVDSSLLEQANGRMWGAELVVNTFIGPVLGSFLLTITFALPFFVDAGSFAVAAGLVFLIGGQFRAPRTMDEQRQRWQAQLREGVRWLRGHELLWPMAVILGLLNAIGMMVGATFVLYAQEVLDTSALGFAFVTTGAAVGGIIGSLAAPRISRAIGPGPSLAMTMIGGAVGSAALAVTSSWPVAWLASGVETGLAALWNVITVSLRQAIIPDHLLGRVNSVYRFLGWGMMPIGSLVGGLVVAFGDQVTTRELALRLPFVIAMIGNLILLAFGARRLTTAKIEAARAAGKAPGPAAAV